MDKKEIKAIIRALSVSPEQAESILSEGKLSAALLKEKSPATTLKKVISNLEHKEKQ